MTDVIIVPEEERTIIVPAEGFIIEVPPEWRIIHVEAYNMILGSMRHTAGDTRRWIVSYDRWLDNAASIVSADVSSSSDTCTIDKSEVKGKDVIFLLAGGEANEQLTVTLKMTDNFDNEKTDTIVFAVVAP